MKRGQFLTLPSPSTSFALLPRNELADNMILNSVSSNIALDLRTDLLALALLVLLWLGFAVAYRLFLSPIARIPGPTLAAFTGWYETYYDCFKQGRFWLEVERMHDQYGPIVRISPWEVHVNDPDWTEPYTMSARADKYHWYYAFVGSSDAAFGTSDFELHRRRRAAQQGYFTQAAIAHFDPTLDNIVAKLIKRLQEFRDTDQPVNLSNAYRSLATDIVTEFAFHKSYGLLEAPDFSASFQRTVRDFPELGLWHRHFGFILDLFQAMPRWMVALINPVGLSVVDFFNDIEKQTTEIIAADKAKPPTDTSTNIVSQMLASPDLAPRDKSCYRLALEVRTFVGAGTETTGNTLSVTTFHLLANPRKAQRLRKEIHAAQNRSKTPLRYQDLQQLSYLCAVVSEGYRISTSVAGRLPRINTQDTMKYGDYLIPAGTVVSMTQKLTHDNPTIFPDPRTFLPERWLDPADRRRLEKYLKPFGRGSRACIGQHLANAEIHICLARIFGEFEMKLFDTDREDIEQVHDFFSPFPSSFKGLRVTVE